MRQASAASAARRRWLSSDVASICQAATTAGGARSIWSTPSDRRRAGATPSWHTRTARREQEGAGPPRCSSPAALPGGRARDRRRDARRRAPAGRHGALQRPAGGTARPGGDDRHAGRAARDRVDAEALHGRVRADRAARRGDDHARDHRDRGDAQPAAARHGPARSSSATLPAAEILHLAPVAAELAGEAPAQLGVRRPDATGLRAPLGRAQRLVVACTPDPAAGRVGRAMRCDRAERGGARELRGAARARPGSVARRSRSPPARAPTRAPVRGRRRPRHLPVEPVADPADDLGAGDVYAAAFFTGLAAGDDAPAAAAAGARRRGAADAGRRSGGDRLGAPRSRRSRPRSRRRRADQPASRLLDQRGERLGRAPAARCPQAFAASSRLPPTGAISTSETSRTGGGLGDAPAQRREEYLAGLVGAADQPHRERPLQAGLRDRRRRSARRAARAPRSNSSRATSSPCVRQLGGLDREGRDLALRQRLRVDEVRDAPRSSRSAKNSQAASPSPVAGPEASRSRSAARIDSTPSQ